jgi:mRNA interferase MazF
VKRGEVWWASLPDPVGSGPGLRRPVVIVQSNAFTESRIATVIVAVVTSNLALAEAPGNVRLAKSESGLPQPSVINVSQLITVDKSILTGKVKSLPSSVMRRVEDGIRLVLSLEG